MRAHYCFLAALDAPIIQGRILIKGVHVFLLKVNKGYLVSKMVKYTHSMLINVSKLRGKYLGIHYADIHS